MRAWIVVLLAWLCLAAPALAENRLALVIGNNDYQHIAKLKKAVADATAYASVLREKGFSVQIGYDLTTADMNSEVASFVEKIESGDTAVFIYSGHGWSDGAHNYLLGVDAPGRFDQEGLARLSVPLRNGADGVLDGIQHKNPTGLIAAIIDACRDNPFQPPSGQKGYAVARGLKPQSVEGSFVIYSAGEGQTAMDALSEVDPDPNSVFTRTFLPQLRTDRPLQDAIKISQQQTHALADKAGHDQTPAYYDNVLGEACLSAACKTSGAASTETGTGRKVALVIGNSKYASLGELPNPANDADSIGDALTKIGFTVTVKKDLTRQEFVMTLKEFSHESSNADTALFYFSGHGVQVSSKNNLIPIDTEAENIKYDSIPIDPVVEATNKAHKTKILVLDASRDDGVSNKFETATASRSLTDATWTGFAPFESINNADGLIILYSAQPGKEAINDAGSKNSPFAESLAKRLVEPNAKIADTLRLVASDVAASTGNLQKPVYSTALPDIVLYPAETADEAWRAIKDSDDPVKLRDFIKRFSNSQFADFAQYKLNTIDELRRKSEELKALRESQEKAIAESDEAKKRADEISAAEAARIAKEQADKEQAAREEVERKKKMEEDRLAAEQKAADEKRKADAAAAEQARIAKEKADLDAETKRLAEEAAALERKQAEEADAQRKEELARQAEENDRKAKEAAEAAQKLEAEKQRANLEEEARKEQAAREEAERKEKMEEDRLAAEQKAADEKHNAEAAAAEQARLAKEKADKEAETNRLADEAAALAQKQAEEADAQRKQELARQAEENDRKAKEAAEAAQKLEAEKQRAKLEEEARQEQAAREDAERQKKMEADRQAAEQKAAEDKRKAETAAAEQARLAKEKADKDAETKRLADEAAAIKQKQAEEAEAARKEQIRREAEEKDRKAKEAAEAAQKLEQAKLEEEARKKQEDEAKAKRIAEACAHDQAELAQLAEAGQRGAIQALGGQSLCPALPAAANQAIKDIVAREAKLCADDQAAFARIDQKDETQLKAALETFKCDSVRTSASAQIAKLASERAHQEQVCADERVKFAAIDLFAPPAMDQLAALAGKAECTALRAEISKTSDDLKTRLTDAQSELQRLGCYSPVNPSGRFDDATIAALKKYLAARKASADPLKITEALVDELEDQDVKFCAPQPAPPPPVVAKPSGTPKEPVIASRPPTHPQWESAPPLSLAHPQREREHETPPAHPQREFAPPSSSTHPPREFAPPSNRRKHYDAPDSAPPREREAFHARPEVQPPAQPQRPYSAPSQGMSPPMGTMN